MRALHAFIPEIDNQVASAGVPHCFWPKEGDVKRDVDHKSHYNSSIFGYYRHNGNGRCPNFPNFRFIH